MRYLKEEFNLIQTIKIVMGIVGLIILLGIYFKL